MSKKLFIGVLITLAINSFSQVIPNIDWVKIYNPRFQRANSPSALDANNNVYVTGYISNSPSNQDLIVLKYDSLGTLLWQYIYNNGGNDAGTAIKVSSTGNVYVTGQSYDASSNFDYYTIKLSPAGSVLWSARYDYSGSTDGAVDIKIDEPASKVYVTGSGFNGTDNDIITLLYDDSNGSLVWNNVYDGGVSGNDDAVGLVVVDNGNFLMIAGNCINSSGNYDIAAINIKNDGSPNWTYYTDGTAGANDNAKAIITTGANVAICGMLNNSTTNQDYTTIVIDALTPSLVWQNNYDVSNGVQAATSLVSDSTGNIAVTGYAISGGIYQYHTLLYTPAGTQVFTNIENTGINNLYIEPRVATDTIAHHFYVSGAKLNTNNDVFVYQIAPSGNTKWREYYNGSSNLGDAATGLVVNGIGVVYLSALSLNSSGNWDITTIKVSQTPVIIPVNYNLVPDTFSFSNLFYQNTGEILDTAFNPVNSILYYTKFTYPNQYILNDRVAFCELHQGSINGQISDTLSRVDMIFNSSNKFTKAYPINIQNNSSLNYFLQQLGSTDKTDVKGASHVIIPNIYPNIDLWLSSNSVGSKYYFVVKPNANPSQIKLSFQGAINTNLVSNNLKITSKLGSWTLMKPDIYNIAPSFIGPAFTTPSVTGVNGWSSIGNDTYSINPGNYNPALPLIIEFDMGKQNALPTGSLNCEWSTYVGGGNNDSPSQVKSNNANELFVVGYTTSNNFPLVSGSAVFQNINAGSNDGYIEKYDANGVRLWATYVGGANTDQIKSIDFAANGDLYIIGQTSSALPTFPKAGATNSLSQLGGQDGFILQTNPSSNQKKWMTYFGGNSDDTPWNCKFDASGNFYIVGNTKSKTIPVIGTSPQYTQTAGTVTNTTDGILFKYNSASQIVWQTYLSSTDDGSNGIDTDGLRDLDFNSNGELYVVGFASGNNYPNVNTGASTNYTHTGLSSSPDGVISHFGNNGQLIYSTYFGGNGLDYFTSIKCNNNKIFITGQRDPLGSNFPVKNSGNWFYSTASSGLSDCPVVIFDSNDFLIHSTFLQGNSNMIGWDIAADITNRIYISGITRSSIFPTNLNQTANAYVNTFKGSSDYFLYALQENNTNIIWATTLGSNDDEGFFYGLGSGYIDINNQNYLHIVGTTEDNSTTFPLFNGAGVPYFDGLKNGTLDASVTRFNLNVVNGIFQSISENTVKSELMIFPNPTNNYLNIATKDLSKNINFEIYNMLGQNLKSGLLTESENIIDVSSLVNGMYILVLKDGKNKTSNKFIKGD